MDRLTAFVAQAAAEPVLEPMRLDDPALAPKLAVARQNDPRVAAWMELLVTKHTSFCLFDVEMYPACFVREPRDPAARQPGDVCLAKNGAGDLYVWNAHTGEVRFLVHDEGWRTRSTYGSVDQFVEAVLAQAVEYADRDQIDEATDAYVARFVFALGVAGDEMLDEDVRAALVERGVLAD